jgi:hypothetical protein
MSRRGSKIRERRNHLGSVIDKGPGSGKGGRREGAGRKPTSTTPRAIRDRARAARKAGGAPNEALAVEYAEILPPKEAARVKRERVESFRRFARDFVLDNLAYISDEIMRNGTRSERASLLNWMSQQAYGLPSKTPVQVNEDGVGIAELLQKIADERTARAALPPAPEGTEEVSKG